MDRRERKARAKEKIEGFEPPNIVLMEMDGVLLDSMSVLYRAYCTLLGQHQLVATKQEFRKFIGLPIREYLSLLCEVEGIRRSVDLLVHEYRKILLPDYSAYIPLVSGVQEFLKFAKRAGLTVVLVSAQEKELTQAALGKHELSQFFDAISAADELAISSPPNNPYRHGLALVGTEASDAIAITYTLSAMEASLDVAIKTLWLHSSISSHQLNNRDLIKFNDWKVVEDLFFT